MSAFYNENDAQKAAWLRELIRQNVIAQGEVDERSITEVEPADLRGFTQCHFFAGIGGWSYALRLARWPDDQPVWTGSCPCQETRQCSHGQQIEFGTCYVEFNGWPAGVITPYGGILAAGAVANEDAFIAALKAATPKAA